MVHRKILDVAEANPDASMEAIAEAVSGASVTFVERVLEEYGDPAATASESNRADDIDADGGRQEDPADSESDATSKPGSDSGSTSKPGAGDNKADAGDNTSTDTANESVEPAERLETVKGSTGVEQDADRAASDGQESSSDTEAVTDPSELTEKQYETLVAVHDDPAATQAEIGERLDVSRATVSKRLSGLSGFEWATRRQFVDRLFEERGKTKTESVGGDPAVEEATLEDLSERVETLESELKRQTTTEDSGPQNPRLVHKMVHACMEAEYISRDEELRILQTVLPSNEIKVD